MPGARTRYQRNPTDFYMAHGDTSPPLVKLVEYDEALSGAIRPHLNVLHTNVLQDMALADPENAQKYLDKARANIDEMLATADALYNYGYKNDAQKNATHYVTASLQRAELPHWEQAAQSKDVAMGYDTMLDGVNAAIEYVYEESDYGTLAEFTPLLLFARAEKIHKTRLYIGRMSLIREDGSLSAQKGHNKNWDTGLSQDPKATRFAIPEDRVQIKRGNTGSASHYNDAGVIFLRARELGFDDTVSIVDSCLAERGDSVAADAEIYTPGELDHITESIVNRLDCQRQKIADLGV